MNGEGGGNKRDSQHGSSERLTWTCTTRRSASSCHLQEGCNGQLLQLCSSWSGNMLVEMVIWPPHHTKNPHENRGDRGLEIHRTKLELTTNSLYDMLGAQHQPSSLKGRACLSESRLTETPQEGSQVLIRGCKENTHCLAPPKPLSSSSCAGEWWLSSPTISQDKPQDTVHPGLPMDRENKLSVDPFP